ncbi:hypothetical protein Hypma_000591 [Hypsizygus marmoreus]|uniref:F-box domain-containing protein n=1 Tax=Hypsizygus marmoreus TaxID=39966 RepID=A0A369JFZ6_HYPMA|nr:hypothetical protein Hypma_000591 [Hypsizygus marmoreus]
MSRMITSDVVSQRSTYPPCSGLSSLPTELLHLIFEPLCPKLKRHNRLDYFDDSYG